MSDNKKIEMKTKAIKINYVYPDDLKSYFSTNSVVQHQKDHFILSFFETWPPAILGSKEEQLSQFNHLDKINAKCVARIILTPDKMGDLIRVLEENYHTFLEKQQGGKK